jgi:uncharacterized protein (DUF1778 family)
MYNAAGQWLKAVHMTEQIGIRMPASEIVLLKKVSQARGEDLSDFVRRAIKTELARLSYLTSDEKKALGIGLSPHQASG